MLEAIAASAVLARNAQTFTVIWQGINVEEIYGDNGAITYEDQIDTFLTEVVPGEYGHIDVDAITIGEWGNAACGEQFDGDNPYEQVDVLYVLEGGSVIHVDGNEAEYEDTN